MKRIRKTEIPPVVVELGMRIKEIIRSKNLTQKDVAYEAGLDVENLRKYLKGTQEMKVSTMLKLAKALDVEVKDLF